MIILDSSIIIAAFRRNEIHHQDAINIMKQNEDIMILDYVITEVATVLKMREGETIANKCLDFLVNNQNIEICFLNNDEFSKTVNYFLNHKNKLSFIDTALFVFSKSKKIALATFDKELGKSFN
jgi:predicted nucleic acid-binding protein